MAGFRGLSGVHPYDVAQLAGEHDVALGVGNHACQRLMNTLDIPGTIRASFGLYNSQEDIGALLSTIDKARRLLL